MELFRKLKKHGPDSREGLKTLFFSFVTVMLTSMSYKTQGLCFEAGLREFKATRKQMSWPMSIYQFAMNFSGEQAFISSISLLTRDIHLNQFKFTMNIVLIISNRSLQTSMSVAL